MAWLKINPPSHERWNSIAILVYRRVRTPFFSNHQILTYIVTDALLKEKQTRCSSLSALGNVTALPAPSFAPAGVVVRHSPSPTVFFPPGPDLNLSGQHFWPMENGVICTHPLNIGLGNIPAIFSIRICKSTDGWSWWARWRINQRPNGIIFQPPRFCWNKGSGVPFPFQNATWNGVFKNYNHLPRKNQALLGNLPWCFWSGGILVKVICIPSRH